VTRPRQPRYRSFALLALLMALLARAGIPAGYMLAPVDGLLRIVPCTGTAPAVSHRHSDSHGQPGKAPEVPCAFALVAPPALPGAPPLLAPPPPAPALIAAATAEGAGPRLRAVLPPPATGPPSA
jgi:hypothetical protein